MIAGRNIILPVITTIGRKAIQAKKHKSELQRATKERIVKKAKSGDKDLLKDLSRIEDILTILKKGDSLFEYLQDDENKTFVNEVGLLSAKPVIFVANLNEDMEETDGLKKLREKAHSNGSQLIEMCNQIEFEISELENESRQELIDLVGLEEPGLNKLIKTAFRTLGLQTFFTSGQSESRAWVIKNEIGRAHV